MIVYCFVAFLCYMCVLIIIIGMCVRVRALDSQHVVLEPTARWRRLHCVASSWRAVRGPAARWRPCTVQLGFLPAAIAVRGPVAVAVRGTQLPKRPLDGSQMCLLYANV